MSSCILCDSDKDLNTEMSVSVEGEKVSVVICDECADDATPKRVRQAYTRKMQEIEKFMKIAKSMGFEISKPGEKGIVVASDPPPLPGKTPPQLPAPEVINAESRPVKEEAEDDDDPDVIDTTRLDQQAKKGMRSVGGVVDEFGVHVKSHNSYSTDHKDIPEEVKKGKAKMAIGEGRGGQPIAFPKKRQDGLGTTRINIIKKETDATLQQRFKNMAAASKEDRGPSFKDGYGQDYGFRDCPICHGECVVMEGRGERTCPKCDGQGVISTG